MKRSLTWVDGEWVDGNAPFFSSMSHGVWLSSFIFDGARFFEGVAPDLDLHCERALNSAKALGLKDVVTQEEMMRIAWEGHEKMGAGQAYYIRPIIWADDGFVAPDPESTRFALTVFEAPMPEPVGFSACLSTRRRPMPNAAPTDTKSACLYPNAGRALQEARAKGFDNAVTLDPIGNVAEFATANIFHAKDGKLFTPMINGTFLNGVTRRRVIALMREKGYEVHETRVTHEDLLEADEIFNTGNWGKLMPLTRYEDRDLQPGPIFKTARELYWEYSHAHGAPKV